MPMQLHINTHTHSKYDEQQLEVKNKTIIYDNKYTVLRYERISSASATAQILNMIVSLCEEIVILLKFSIHTWESNGINCTQEIKNNLKYNKISTNITSNKLVFLCRVQERRLLGQSQSLICLPVIHAVTAVGF